MVISHSRDALEQFIHAIRSHMENCVSSGVLEGFVCTAVRRVVHAATLINGLRHTKAPMQVNTPIHIEVSLVLPGGRGVGFSLEALSMPLFVMLMEFSLAQSVELEHRIQLQRQSEYPKIVMSSAELLRCFESNSAGQVMRQLLEQTDSFAEQVKHPLLMNREVNVSISRSERRYFDSVGNSAREHSAACSIMCSFSLEDSSEGHSDLFGTLPSSEEVKAVVDEAAKNITRSAVKALDSSHQLPVLLTHKAVGDLFEMLVLPNLETRALIDKTGAWELAALDSVVLPGVTIEDNPHLEQSPFSSVFDFEGTPTQPVKMMKSGSLIHPLMTSSLLAEVESLHPEWKGRFHLTGHAESASTTTHTNLFIRIDKPALPDLRMLAYVQIQNLTGMSVDSQTGQFALDADGAKVIEGGRVKYSTSLTLRGNFFEALTHVSTKVGKLERHFNVWTPSLFTEVLSTVSKELAQDFEDLGN